MVLIPLTFCLVKKREVLLVLCAVNCARRGCHYTTCATIMLELLAEE